MRSPVILIAVSVAAIALSACATTRAAPRPYPAAPPPMPSSSGDAGRMPGSLSPSGSGDPARAGAATDERIPTADAVLEVAEGLLGTPYRSGGADPDGFDCSGFVQYAFARAGVSLPRSVRDQWRAGEPVEPEDVRRGDLVFFAIGGREVSHVGIALDAATFVHAPSARGVVRVERANGEYWVRRFAGARRVTD